MIRIPGWILGIALVATACGAGDQPEAQESEPSTSAANPPATQPAQPDPRGTEPADSQPAAQQARAESEPPASAPAVTGRLYTVQVGAFLTGDSARVWTDRLTRRGLPVWTTQATVDGRTFHRLRIGASPSLAEARRLGAQLTREYHWPIWIAPVDDNAAVPANAIARTNALVTGG